MAQLKEMEPTRMGAVLLRTGTMQIEDQAHIAITMVEPEPS